MNWRRIEKLPPILCRLLARHPRGLPLTNSEIAARCRLSRQHVAFIATRPTWDDVGVAEMREFLAGCGLDFCSSSTMKRVDVYLRDVRAGRVKLSRYLRRAPHFQDELAHLVPLVAAHIAKHPHLYAQAASQT